MSRYYEKFFQKLGINTDLLNKFHIGIAIYNRDGIIIFANDAFKHMYGVGDIELVGMNVHDFFLTAQAGIKTVLDTGEASSFRSISKNGYYGVAYRWPLKDKSGKIVGAVSENFTVSQDKEKITTMEKFLGEIQNMGMQPVLSRLDVKIERDNFEAIRGKSPGMLALKEKARKFASSDHQVLITGENGTGKDLLAQAIHAASSRRHNNFISVNCAAIPGELLESELFGYESGAFTGAREKGKQGQFELADGGTIFLDEIGEIPYPLQAKLLRVLENREIQKLGSQKPITVNFRLLSATNRDLEKLVLEGRFRADLYYRLNLFDLAIPPLRDRLEDIPDIAEYILKSLREREGCNGASLSQDVLDAFYGYAWTGNVRELRNILTYAVYSMKNTETEITLEHLPERFFRHDIHSKIKEIETPLEEHAELIPAAGMSIESNVSSHDVGFNKSVKSAVQEIERKSIMNALMQTGGNKARAAKILGISRSNLYKKLEMLNIR